MSMERITTCRVCQSKNLEPFFDLGKQPLANSLPDHPGEKEEFYPLSLSFCRDCSLVQLDETIPPEILFSHYLWITGTSATANRYADSFCDAVIASTDRPKDGYVLEVASNDGTFLIPFQKKGFTVLGIDPAENIAAMARQQGIPTEAVFFGTAAAKDIVTKHGKAKIVFARNVLPHVAGTRDFVAGLRDCLSDDGTLAVEVHYAKVILDDLHYDSIYHEHLCYFTLKSLERLFNDFGLHIFNITQSPISGGSIVAYAKKRAGEVSPSVAEYRAEEARSRTNDLESWKGFAARSFAHREKLLALLREQKGRGGKIAGWGASARSSTLLNFCGITTDILPAIIDLNPLKQGKYTAGTHIPIEKAEDVMDAHPDCIFLLAWNFQDEIISILGSKFKFKGVCILPFPKEPHSVELGG